METVDAELSEAAPSPRRRRAPARLLRRLMRQPAGFGAGLLLLAVFLAGAIVPSFAPFGNSINLSAEWRNHPPTLTGWHLLGTNGIGQDILLRTVYGLHVTEQSALFATLLATLIGVTIGATAGYRGGWTDALLMRVADMLGVFPALLLLLAAYVYFHPVTVFKATVILSCYLWIPVARVVRAEIASLRGRGFVEAAVSLGASNRRIFFRHLLPNASSTIVIGATSLFGLMIMLEATVEFFGLGISSAQQQTIGNLIGDGQQATLTLGWNSWGWGAPAILLIVILVCANLLGDGVADALRPTRRR
jgi:ABC-type dipeptide/oligopeptide/nickel transport system permease subunit